MSAQGQTIKCSGEMPNSRNTRFDYSILISEIYLWSEPAAHWKLNLKSTCFYRVTCLVSRRGAAIYSNATRAVVSGPRRCCAIERLRDCACRLSRAGKSSRWVSLADCRFHNKLSIALVCLLGSHDRDSCQKAIRLQLIKRCSRRLLERAWRIDLGITHSL